MTPLRLPGDRGGYHRIIMSTDRGSRRRRWFIGIGVALIVLVATAVIVRYTILRDQARVVAVDDVLESFRSAVDASSSTAPPPDTTVATTAPGTTTPSDHPATTTSTEPEPIPVATTPEPGVYRYRTTGEESVDILGGATHHYPDETTITVLPDGCGVHLRWDALQERREEWRLCATEDGIELQPHGFKYQEFFSQANPEDIVCDGVALIVPVDRGARPVTELDCMLGDDPWFPVWEVLGWEERQVGQTTVDVVHVRMTVDDPEAEYWEVTTIDWWLASNGLPVAAEATKRSRSPSPIGGVVYEEEFTLDLVSLTPLR